MSEIRLTVNVSSIIILWAVTQYKKSAPRPLSQISRLDSYCLVLLRVKGVSCSKELVFPGKVTSKRGNCHSATFDVLMLVNCTIFWGSHRKFLIYLHCLNRHFLFLCFIPLSCFQVSYDLPSVTMFVLYSLDAKATYGDSSMMSHHDMIYKP